MASVALSYPMKFTQYPVLVTDFPEIEKPNRVLLSITAEHLNQLKALLISNGIPFEQNSELSPVAEPNHSFSRATIEKRLQQFSLSSREHEVMIEMINGLEYQEIADKLFISLETVRSHVKNSFKKIQVSSRAEAIARILKLN